MKAIDLLKECSEDHVGPAYQYARLGLLYMKQEKEHEAILNYQMAIYLDSKLFGGYLV